MKSVLAIVLLLLFSVNLFAEDIHTNEDLKVCNLKVISYLESWEKRDFEKMYSYLSSQHIGSISKKTYLRQQEQYLKWDCRLLECVITEFSSSEDNIIVKVQIKLSKELKPNLANGEYSFHMVKIAGEWKIKTILAPVDVVNPNNLPANNSHPGM